MADRTLPLRIVEARFVASAPRAALLPPPTGVEIAFAGRSNVGKSTLLNALLQRKGLARTSSTPGCTRDLAVFEARTADGARLTFVDLPGFGYAKRSKAERASWGPLVEGYLLERASLVCVVLLVDVRRGVEPDDQEVLDLVAAPPRISRRPPACLLVATKLDKVNASARKPALVRLRASAGRAVFGFSAEDPSTHADLWRAVLKATGIGAGAAEGGDG